MITELKNQLEIINEQLKNFNTIENFTFSKADEFDELLDVVSEFNRYMKAIESDMRVLESNFSQFLESRK